MASFRKDAISGARFQFDESEPVDQLTPEEREDGEDLVSDEELAAEDALWEANMVRHAERFTALKAQAKADVKAQRAVPMFDEREEFNVE